MDVKFGAATDQGRVRTHNEDSYLTAPPVFVVADGMGGHSRGEAASRAVVDAFSNVATQRWVTTDDVIGCVERAAKSVQALQGELKAPGSTVSGVALSQQAGVPCWLIFNIGDSRTYLVRDDALTQISVDHSAARDPKNPHAPRNVITRALGAGLKQRAVADQWLIPAAVGDRLLVCSDGLTGELSDQLIAATLIDRPDPQQAARTLVDSALQAGGHDNVTAVVVVCSDLEGAQGVALGLDDDTESNIDDDDDTITESWEDR